MPLRHGLLGLLNYGKMTGYELHKIFHDSLYFFWHAQPSQIYRELNAMEKEGLLTSEIQIQNSRPNRKIYTITDSGKAELNRWLSEGHTEDALSLHSAFLMNLFLAGNLSREENVKNLKLLHEKCKASLTKIQDSETETDSIGPKIDSDQKLYWGLTSIYGRYYYEMCLRWTQDAIRILEGWS